MSRFFARLILIPLLIFTVALLLIHIRPHNDEQQDQLRHLLQPDDCAAPCFMGIRPGVTTREEAIKLLVASQWIVNEPAKWNTGSDLIPILFDWNGDQPALIDPKRGLTLTFQDSDPVNVAQIAFRLQNEITLGDVYLTLGRPSRYSWPTLMAPNTGPNEYIMIVYHQYDDSLINLLSISDCPLSLSRLLHQSMTEIEYGAILRSDLPTSTLREILRYPNCG